MVDPHSCLDRLIEQGLGPYRIDQYQACRKHHWGPGHVGRDLEFQRQFESLITQTNGLAFILESGSEQDE